MAEIIKRSTSNERNDPTIERVIPNSGRLDRTCGVRLHGTGHRRAEIPWRLLRRISFHRWRKVAKQFQRDAHLDKQTRRKREEGNCPRREDYTPLFELGHHDVIPNPNATRFFPFFSFRRET